MVGKDSFFNLTSGFFTVRTEWSETYDIASNSSIVQVDSLQIQTSYLGNEYPSGYININGVRAVTFDGFRGTHSFYVGIAGTWVALGGNPAAPWKSGSIVHNTDGTKSIVIEVNLSGTIMGSGWSVSGSQAVELTAIPRASTPTLSTASPYAGDTVTLYTNRKVNTYTHDITYTFGNTSGTIGTNVGASTSWAIPISLAKAITGTSGTLKIRTVTKNGSAVLGTVDIDVTLRIPDNDITKPAINSVFLTPVHDLPAKFSGVYVQGRSAIKAQISAGSNYSAVAGYSLNALGKTYTGNPAKTNVLSISGGVSVKSTVTDKRGYARSVTNEVLYYPYSAPSVAPTDGRSQIVCKRCKEDGTIDISGLYLRIDAGKKFSGVNGLNQCELRYRYATAGGAFSNWITLLEKGSADNNVSVILEGVVDSAVTAYTVEIGVVDDIGSEKSVTFPIGTASAVWHAAEGGEALGIGGYAQRKGVDVFWDMHMNGKSINGIPPSVNLLDNSDFTNPINQREKNSYNSAGYTIDRWKIDVGNITLSVESGYVKISSAVAGYNVSQPVGNALLLAGKKVTFALKHSGDLRIVLACSGTKTDYFYETENKDGLAIGTCTIPDNVQAVSFVIQTKDTGESKIYWAAIYECEYTADTLPDYVPKGYGVELIECMRYYQKLGGGFIPLINNANTIGSYLYRLSVNYPIAMRNVPTITIGNPNDGSYKKPSAIAYINYCLLHYNSSSTGEIVQCSSIELSADL